jgi:hypothetical protein
MPRPARRSRPIATPLLTVALAAALGACGGSSSGNGVASKSPDAIIAASKAAVDKARSVHVTGAVVASGTPIALDLNLLSGKGGRGSVSEGGLSFELVQTGSTVYIKGSPAFYRHVGGTAAAQLFQGKWLKAPVNSGTFGSLSSLTNLRQLADSAFANHGKLVKGASTTVNGQKAISVKEPAKSQTLYVATTGQPYPIQVTGSGADKGTLSFDRWNQPVSLTAPAHAIDISQLKSAH